MPTNKAITKQESAAWIRPVTVDSSNQITALGTEITFDYIEGAGPVWPASESSSSGDQIEIVAANGITVVYPKETKVYDGVTGTEKDGGSSSSAGHKLKFTSLEWGKTLASTIPPLQGKYVLCCIPIGRNVTASERGFYYLLGKLSNEISYDAKGDTVVSVDIEVTGASATATTAGDTALEWAPGAITPVGSSTAMTPSALTTSDIVMLKSGVIIVK